MKTLEGEARQLHDTLSLDAFQGILLLSTVTQSAKVGLMPLAKINTRQFSGGKSDLTCAFLLRKK